MLYRNAVWRANTSTDGSQKHKDLGHFWLGHIRMMWQLQVSAHKKALKGFKITFTDSMTQGNFSTTNRQWKRSWAFVGWICPTFFVRNHLDSRGRKHISLWWTSYILSHQHINNRIRGLCHHFLTWLISFQVSWFPLMAFFLS